MRRTLRFKNPEAYKVLSGLKSATLRVTCDRYLNFKPGDTFELRGRVFRISSIMKIRVSEINDEIARLEGFNNKDELLRRLRQIYPNSNSDFLLFRFEEVLFRRLMK